MISDNYQRITDNYQRITDNYRRITDNYRRITDKYQALLGKILYVNGPELFTGFVIEADETDAFELKHDQVPQPPDLDVVLGEKET